MGDDGPVTRDRGPEHWDARYAASEHVWSRGPNAEVARVLADLRPGRALDVGAGEGRHALWLAARGWTVTAVDFSRVGVERGAAEARAAGLAVDWQVADATTWVPPEGAAYDLVLVVYMHLPKDVVQRATSWLAPGGSLVVLGHALRNLADGVGGPQDPSILHTPEALRDKASGLHIARCEEVVRPTPDGDAIDVVLVASRPA